ncbi:MAG: DNA polymerase III subunit chi [Pseudomonadota bacterium]
MTEVWFYHLERAAALDVVPTLLEKTLERGWRAIVRTSDPERIATWDTHLWVYREDSFLPHAAALTDAAPASASEAHHAWLARQQVVLTTATDVPNGATVGFLVDGAAPEAIDGYERVVLLFDGRNADELQAARGHWSALKAAGHALTYWQQDQSGRWQKKA